MDEAGVDHAVGGRRATAQAVEVIERAAMRGGSSRREGCSRTLGAGEADDLVSGREEVLNHGGTDKAGGTSNEYTHEDGLLTGMETDVDQCDILVK